MSQYCHPVHIPIFRLVKLISHFSSGCKIQDKGDKRKGIRWQISRNIRMAKDGYLPFSVELCSQKTVQAQSFQQLYPWILFHDIVQITFSLWVIHKLTVLHMLHIWYHHRALQWGIFNHVALAYKGGWVKMKKEKEDISAQEGSSFFGEKSRKCSHSFGEK